MTETIARPPSYDYHNVPIGLSELQLQILPGPPSCA